MNSRKKNNSSDDVIHQICHCTLYIERHHMTHGAYNRYASASKQKYLSKMSARENEIPDLSENVNSRLGRGQK